MMDRRRFLAGIGAVAIVPVAVQAQQPGKIYRIGVLTPFSLTHSLKDGPAQAFFDELPQLGWIEGKNFVFDWPDSEGKPEQLMRLAEELVRRQPDMILAGGLPGALAA